MEDYILGFMNDAVDFVRKSTGNKKIHKMGICQGGTFSTIFASLHPEKLQSLTVYVAPFDFSGNECMLYRWTKDLDIDAMVDGCNGGLIPADTIDSGFSMLKPSAPYCKIPEHALEYDAGRSQAGQLFAHGEMESRYAGSGR
jgi:polyhydroxyalkanoate synthase